MSKLEWGAKRVCIQCGTRFYDLQKKPIICPKCGATYDSEVVSKAKKGRLSSDEKRVNADVLMDSDTPFLIEEVELENVSLEGNELIEDTSELDTEGDDVIDVIEGVEPEVKEEE